MTSKSEIKRHIHRCSQCEGSERKT